MVALTLFGLWLDLATSPFVLLAPLVLTLATGSRFRVRLGTALVAAALGALSALGGAPASLAVACALGGLAGLIVAEIWIALILPVGLGIVRAVRRLVGFLRNRI